MEITEKPIKQCNLLTTIRTQSVNNRIEIKDKLIFICKPLRELNSLRMSGKINLRLKQQQKLKGN